MSVVRWVFEDTVTSDSIVLPLNPNTMTTPSIPRAMNWAWGSKWGVDRIRGMESPLDGATEWSFGGVILSEAHYDLLLAWAGRLVILNIQDHLLRRFKVVIRKFDPVERLPTALHPWRADYTMTCLFLERLPDA